MENTVTVTSINNISYTIKNGGSETTSTCNLAGLQAVLAQQFVGCSTWLRVTFPENTQAAICMVDRPFYIYSNTRIDFNGWNFKRSNQAASGVVLGNELIVAKGNSNYATDMEGNTQYEYIKNVTLMNGGFINNYDNVRQDCLARFPHGDYITLYNMSFIGLPYKHQVVFAGCSHVSIKQCVFDGGYARGSAYSDKWSFETLHLDWIGADWQGHMSEGYGACVKGFKDPTLTPDEKKGADGTSCSQIYVSDCKFLRSMTGLGSHDGFELNENDLTNNIDELDTDHSKHLGSVGEDYTVQNCYFEFYNSRLNLPLHNKVYTKYLPFDRLIESESPDLYKYRCVNIQEDETKYFPKCMSVTYRAHIQTTGNQNWVKDGQIAGTIGLSKRIEGLWINIDTNLYHLDSSERGEAEAYDSFGQLGIQYRSHIQGTGWESSWKSNGEYSGTTGESKRIEAIQIRLTGALSSKYEVYYRAHVQNYGWLAWASHGEIAGSMGLSKRMEAIQIVLVPKNGILPTESPMDNYDGVESVLDIACVTA